jgi:predicted metal-dependent peptidase
MAISTQLKENISRAKAQLIVTQPFIASILLRREIIWTDRISTLAVDPKAQLYANPKFAEKLGVPELIFGLAHESMHIVFQHALRRNNRDAKGWNWAADAVINDTLKEAGIGELISGGVYVKGAKDKTTEQIYEELESQEQKACGGIGQDLIDDPNMSEAERKQVEATVKIEIAQAAQAARMQGKLTGVFERLVEEILTVKTPWHEILERWMVNISKQDYSWSRPNRRHIAVDATLYLPTLASRATMGEMVLGIDVSGSIGEKELAFFGAHLNRILEVALPEKLHVVYCDTDVSRTLELVPEDLPVQLKSVGGGGTDMRKILEWVDTQGIDPACAVVLTDGYTPWPDVAPDYPLLWAITTNVVAPVGETVHFELGVEQ